MNNEQEIADAAIAFARREKKAIAGRATDPKIFVPEAAPVSVFMAGSPGAGKTEASIELLANFIEPIIRIDPDELRAKFPGFNGSNSHLFQSAISVLVEKIHDMALEQSQSFILDGTLSNLNKARDNVKRSLRRGRLVQILYVYQAPLLAWKFVQAREAAEGRRIPPAAFIDQYFAARKRPTFHSFNGMYPLHEDIELSDEQVQIVKDYLREVNFHLPGATPEEFNVVRWARYTGFQFLSEPLSAYAVGLRCTHPGMENHHTFIRMSWEQLMGRPDAERLPVNEPVLASDMMTLQRYRDTPTGPSRTGIDSYTAVAGDGPPGADFDLKLLDGALDDVLELHASGEGEELNSWWNPAIHWGVAMAGRYPRLKYYESKGRLTAAQASALREFEERAVAARPALDDVDERIGVLGDV